MQFKSLLAVLATSARTVLVKIKTIFKIKQNQNETSNELVNKKIVTNTLLKFL